ncbi:MAG TPA: hypothetical protein VGK06_06420 [Methanosarcina sp.]
MGYIVSDSKETDLKEASIERKFERANVHVHRPPAVILNETPDEFHIFTGLFQKI